LGWIPPQPPNQHKTNPPPRARQKPDQGCVGHDVCRSPQTIKVSDFGARRGGGKVIREYPTRIEEKLRGGKPNVVYQRLVECPGRRIDGPRTDRLPGGTCSSKRGREEDGKKVGRSWLFDLDARERIEEGGKKNSGASMVVVTTEKSFHEAEPEVDEKGVSRGIQSRSTSILPQFWGGLKKKKKKAMKKNPINFPRGPQVVLPMWGSRGKKTRIDYGGIFFFSMGDGKQKAEGGAMKKEVTREKTALCQVRH